MIVREVRPEDAAEWLAMRRELWPDGDDHDVEIAAFFAGSLEEPEAVVVAEDDGELIGVAEVSLRCDLAGLEGKLTGYVEGLFVRPAFRGRGVALQLLIASREWARGRGCVAFASDRAGRVVVDRGFLVSKSASQMRKSPMLKLVLLPGMDGTGKLFTAFVKALPNIFETEVVQYPSDKRLSYAELASVVQPFIPVSEPFVLIAESFSTPLAIQFAATNPPNLKGLVICAGFATSPIQGWLRFICAFLTLFLFHLPLPKFGSRYLLVGSDASPSLLAGVRDGILSVQPRVLSARLSAILACDARAELSQVVVPILYIRPKQDRLVHAASLEEIVRVKPQTSVMEIDGPHLLLQREPQRTAEVIAKFTQQLL